MPDKNKELDRNHTFEDYIPFMIVMILFVPESIAVISNITGINLTNHSFSDLSVNNGFWFFLGIFVATGVSGNFLSD